MTLFWVYAALLTAVALALLLTPLLRTRATAGGEASRAAANLAVFRDQLVELDADVAAGTINHEQWEAARADLQRGLLEDTDAQPAAAAAPVAGSKAAAIIVLVALPLASVLLYMALGSRQGLEQTATAGAQQGASHELSKEQIEGMVARLAQRLESNPGDVTGWVMLARSYNAMGRFADAAAAYARVEAGFSQDAQFLADYADTLAMAQGQRLDGKPEALIQRALKADPNNVKALALAGTVDFERGGYAKAIEYWRRMLPLLPPDSEMVSSISASIEEAQGKMGQGGSVRPAVAALEKPTSASVTKVSSVSGTVKLGSAFAARAAPEDVVFVLARPAQGSRMPLAATRVKVKDLPLKFSFDDSMSMNPASKLSDFAEVVVVARVSKSGNVVPQPGDFEGSSKPIRPGTSGISVEVASEIK